MKICKPASLLFLVLSISIGLFGQNVSLIRTIYYPSNPYGGPDELKEFVKQEMVYPKDALKEDIEGDVFITFRVNYKGKVIYKEIMEGSDSLIQAEASRIFDKIAWEPDKDRNTSAIGYEKIKFSFDIKKYERLCKKRGYDTLNYEIHPVDFSPIYLSINELDEKPQIKNGKSVTAYVSENIKYPPIAYQMGLSGRVTVEFIIEPYGKTSNIRIVEAAPGGCNEETVRLMKNIDWRPGLKEGKAVRTLFRYQLNFVHPGGTVR